MSAPVGRLAPTPSGHLHLGNALAFAAAWLSARAAGGRLLLRVEDLDGGRARAEIADSQRADLSWLGLTWDDETPAQSQRAYSLAGVPAYRCRCSRRERLAGGCACRDQPRADDGAPGLAGTWRLAAPRAPVALTDRALGRLELPVDEPVLMRDGQAAYPLAVVVDDARDGVSEVVRGADLVDATPAQLVIHAALGLPAPSYLHVPVLVGADGKKLSKSHGATELRSLRQRGLTPGHIWARLLPLLGLASLDPAAFDAARVRRGPFRIDDEGRVLE